MIKLKEGIWTVKRRGPSSEICLTRWNINWSRKVKVKVRKTKLFLNQSAIRFLIEIPLDRLIDNSRYLPTIINRQTGSRSWIVNKCPCCRYLWLKYLFVFLFIAKDLLHMFGVLPFGDGMFNINSRSQTCNKNTITVVSPFFGSLLSIFFMAIISLAPEKNIFQIFSQKLSQTLSKI